MMPRRLDLLPARKLHGRARHERAFFVAMDAVEARNPTRDGLADLDLPVPQGFTAQGIELADYATETACLTICEEWVVMQSQPSDPSHPSDRSVL